MLLQCRNLAKVYPKRGVEVRALDGLDFELAAGEFVVVEGGSGCGKSTLLFSMGGMLRPSSGQVMAEERDLYEVGAAERERWRALKVGFVFQSFHLIPYWSVLENVLASGGGVDARGAGERRAEAESILGRLGLTPRLSHRPSELSAGEQQRVAVARALHTRPSIILADEPTGNLDPESAAKVWEAMAAFHAGGGAVAAVTHGTEGRKFATKLFRMERGRGGFCDLKKT